MGNISYFIFNNCSDSVFYRIEDEEAGEVVKNSPASIILPGEKEIHIWAGENSEGPIKDCTMTFPTKVVEDGSTYISGNYEINVTQKEKRFTLNGETASQPFFIPWLPFFLRNFLSRLPGFQGDIPVLVNISDRIPSPK
jgi:hypothetical protein